MFIFVSDLHFSSARVYFIPPLLCDFSSSIPLRPTQNGTATTATGGLRLSSPPRCTGTPSPFHTAAPPTPRPIPPARPWASSTPTLSPRCSRTRLRLLWCPLATCRISCPRPVLHGATCSFRIRLGTWCTRSVWASAPASCPRPRSTLRANSNLSSLHTRTSHLPPMRASR